MTTQQCQQIIQRVVDNLNSFRTSTFSIAQELNLFQALTFISDKALIGYVDELTKQGFSLRLAAKDMAQQISDSLYLAKSDEVKEILSEKRLIFYQVMPAADAIKKAVNSAEADISEDTRAALFQYADGMQRALDMLFYALTGCLSSLIETEEGWQA